ncbi:hypothetical protein ACMFMG_009331 [Clarireedia jacksonii]
MPTGYCRADSSQDFLPTKEISLMSIYTLQRIHCCFLLSAVFSLSDLSPFTLASSYLPDAIHIPESLASCVCLLKMGLSQSVSQSVPLNTKFSFSSSPLFSPSIISLIPGQDRISPIDRLLD